MEGDEPKQVPPEADKRELTEGEKKVLTEGKKQLISTLIEEKKKKQYLSYHAALIENF